jgi:Mce-associated membrane protein
MAPDPDCADTTARDRDPIAESADVSTGDQHTSEPTTPVGGLRLGCIAGLAIITAIAGLVGWLGFQAHQSHMNRQERALFLRVGRQGALNLTTINYTHIDADVQRILDSSTGTFRDDFRNRSQPFIDMVKQAQSTTEGSITEAGLESVAPDGARVLVAVSVKTSTAAAAQQEPRAWRMRIDVQKVGDSAKVSNVEFVP